MEQPTTSPPHRIGTPLGRWLPGFLGIGAMRAGTTWLADNLRRHPRIWIGRKEQHFFDRHLNARRIPGIDRDREAQFRYALRFLPGSIRGRLVGEFTPRYAILEPETIARIREWMPDVRLLMILRDPVERAWSQARHDRPDLTTRGPAPVSELLRFLDQPQVRQRGDYLSCLRTWLAVFNRDQLWVTFLEHTMIDPEAVVRGTFRFLGVDDGASVGIEARPVHPSPSVPMPDRVRRHLEEIYRGTAAGLEELIGQPVPWG